MFVDEGKIAFLPATVPLEITPGEAVLGPACAGLPDPTALVRIPADFVLLCTGFVADMRLFEQAGVVLEGPRQAPRFDPETMETNVAGLYVAGTAAGGTQREKYQHFIETSHVHVERIVAALTGRRPNPATADRPSELGEL